MSKEKYPASPSLLYHAFLILCNNTLPTLTHMTPSQHLQYAIEQLDGNAFHSILIEPSFSWSTEDPVTFCIETPTPFYDALMTLYQNYGPYKNWTPTQHHRMENLFKLFSQYRPNWLFLNTFEQPESAFSAILYLGITPETLTPFLPKNLLDSHLNFITAQAMRATVTLAGYPNTEYGHFHQHPSANRTPIHPDNSGIEWLLDAIQRGASVQGGHPLLYGGDDSLLDAAVIDHSSTDVIRVLVRAGSEPFIQWNPHEVSAFIQACHDKNLDAIIAMMEVEAELLGSRQTTETDLHHTLYQSLRFLTYSNISPSLNHKPTWILTPESRDFALKALHRFQKSNPQRFAWQLQYATQMFASLDGFPLVEILLQFGAPLHIAAQYGTGKSKAYAEQQILLCNTSPSVLKPPYKSIRL